MYRSQFQALLPQNWGVSTLKDRRPAFTCLSDSGPMRRSEGYASPGSTGRAAGKEIKYKGARRRRWGKWVSEIRIPGSRKRLWLGSYSTPQAAAAAYDTAMFLLRGPSSSSSLNFPDHVPFSGWVVMSPESIQRAASDSGKAVDAELISMEAAGEHGGLS